MEGIEFVEVGGQKARLVDRGEGDPVVVLHGWGGRIESMAPVLTCLEGSFRVIALDLPGFGESPTPRGAWGTADYAAFVRDVLRERGIGPAHFVGHSYGAKTALYLAATDQGLMHKLVLVGSSGLKSPPSMQVRARRAVSKAARTAGKFGRSGSKLRDAVYRRIQSDDYRDAGPMRPILVKVVNEDLTPFLPRITAPTLLVWGTADDSVPVTHARRMEKLIPDAGLVLFEGAGHFAYLDDQDRFCRILRHFLAPRSAA